MQKQDFQPKHITSSNAMHPRKDNSKKMAQNLLLYSFGYVSAINLAMLFPLQTDASTTGISDIDEVVENETNGGKISSTGDDQENLELSLPSHSGLVTDSIFISLLLIWVCKNKNFLQ